jgi:hypothetical protein
LALQGGKPMSSAHRYLDVLDRVAEAHAKAKSAKSAKSDLRGRAQNSQNSQNSRAQKLGSVLVALESRCPDLVPLDRWQQAVADGKTFLSRWGDQAQALGWTARDLFGYSACRGTPSPVLIGCPATMRPASFGCSTAAG